ncbi:MAG: hypothetical protein M1818_002369 [Claussenomyces sp. TS43310]|nr:MAG: hypothetical protein M1818_002369 [Claussenomyces sp. TS43310]
MESRLQLRPDTEELVECWDDEDIDLGGEDLTFRSASLATNATSTQSQHRDSTSSHLSVRSDIESNYGDEERQLHLPGDDASATNDAIAAATRAGIPIPQNVPSSALMGGTIKRLGGRKLKKVIQQDDWNDDLQLPDPGKGRLQMKRRDEFSFPESLRQVSGQSSANPSPVKIHPASLAFGATPQKTLRTKTASFNLNLDRFKDDDFGDEDISDDFFRDAEATIKVNKRQQKPITFVMPPTPQKHEDGDDDNFEADFYLPPGTEPLRLSARKENPRTPASVQDEFEWGEGSLGTRFGGTRRERSNRSSSASALSPSVSSSLTFESEDEGLDGLILPPGPLRFDDILKRRQQTPSPERETDEKQQRKPAPAPAKDDFLSGLEFGDGDVFDSSKLTLNRNIKVKNVRPTSPTRPKTSVSLVFTNKPSPPVNSRLPRPNSGHNRLSSSLAPVSESGGPIANRSTRSHSRLGGHSAQSSITSIPASSTPSFTPAPSTPRRRELNQKSSVNALNQPTTTHAQLLKLKRSAPVLRSNTQSPAKPMGARYDRSPSRTENNSRPISMSRPKTPVERDRSGAESSMSHAKKYPVPFLPAGASQSQSHHITVKTSRHFRRNDSESSSNSAELLRPLSRAMSRSTMRSPSPVRSRFRGAEVLAKEAAKRTLTKPTRRRQFGEGFELDGFDDLPTSQTAEQKFMKQPIARGAPKSLLRNKIMQSSQLERSSTPVPATPSTPSRLDNLPRFARDTNASRMAREQVLAQRAPSSNAPAGNIANQWKAQVVSKTSLSNINNPSIRTKKGRQLVQQKPHLIKPMGDVGKTAKSMKGMVYNPLAFRWEGNENEVFSFDPPLQSPSGTSMPPHAFREKENTTPRPALITNINASQGVQVVGGMVFDPQKMCWLKIPPGGPGQSRDSRSDTSTGADAADQIFDDDDDEEDVFKDVPDLEDRPVSSRDDGEMSGGRKSAGEEGGLKDEWLVGEEFDVGPEFVRRQREEEERWRRKCERWIGIQRDALENDDWRWRIRDVLS